MGLTFKRVSGLIIFLLPMVALAGQGTFVDQQGVIRWRVDNSEVKGFGVNYSLPFAHAYRMAHRLGVDHEEAIKQDIYHMARLGFNLFRVHVWDTEISDSLGNLIHNRHLQLFDFTINELTKRGFNLVITPIAFWGNGWPEPDEDTPGFSNKYGKAGCLVHPDAIKAQENYLAQFLEHVNPYTGIAYKDKANIIAFEVSNEPHHPGTYHETKDFINRMVAAMRGTGTRTPIFYNMSHSIHLHQAYLDANVQGGTFQWYPTGLVAGRTLTGNFLPSVSDYYIPFAGNKEFRREALLVYEFDAADVEGNYIYPALARSFRTEGMQVATHFDYDAMFLAPFNTNYGTHFMSLPYAPQKALSLKIAGKVFHNVPRFTNFGSFPANNLFGNFRVDYESDLAEFVTREQFIYTNDTPTTPPNPAELVEIAGFGNSPLVRYDGKGAYFLDRVSRSTWRLEVMPDAHWLSQPYAPASPRRQVAAVSYREREMQVKLPSLGSEFTVTAINEGNYYSTVATNGRFNIKPGVYLLGAKGKNSDVKPGDRFQNIRLNEFVAPKANLDTMIVKNFTPPRVLTGAEAIVKFELIYARQPQRVEVLLMTPARYQTVEALHLGRDMYQVVIPTDLRGHGTVRYQVVVYSGNQARTFPAGKIGKYGDWDFYDRSAFELHFVPSEWPIPIWNADRNWDRTMRPWYRGVIHKPGVNEGDGRLTFNFRQGVPLNQDGADSSRVYTFKYCFRDEVEGLRPGLPAKRKLVIKGSAIYGVQPVMEVALVDSHGMAFGGKITLNTDENLYYLEIGKLQPTRFALVPRPYPRFKPWFANHKPSGQIDLDSLESVQVTFFPGCDAAGIQEPAKFYLQEIRLE